MLGFIHEIQLSFGTARPNLEGALLRKCVFPGKFPILYPLPKASWPKFGESIFAQRTSTKDLQVKLESGLDIDPKVSGRMWTCNSHLSDTDKCESKSTFEKCFFFESKLNRSWPKFGESIFARRASSKDLRVKAHISQKP